MMGMVTIWKCALINQLDACKFCYVLCCSVLSFAAVPKPIHAEMLQTILWLLDNKHTGDSNFIISSLLAVQPMEFMGSYSLSVDTAERLYYLFQNKKEKGHKVCIMLFGKLLTSSSL